MKLRRTLSGLLALGMASVGLAVVAAEPAGATCAPRTFVVAGYQNGGLGEMMGSAPALAGP